MDLQVLIIYQMMVTLKRSIYNSKAEDGVEVQIFHQHYKVVINAAKHHLEVQNHTIKQQFLIKEHCLLMIEIILKIGKESC
jgi:hypothetical protein